MNNHELWTTTNNHNNKQPQTTISNHKQLWTTINNHGIMVSYPQPFSPWKINQEQTSISFWLISQADPRPTARTWGTVPLRIPLKYSRKMFRHCTYQCLQQNTCIITNVQESSITVLAVTKHQLGPYLSCPPPLNTGSSRTRGLLRT